VQVWSRGEELVSEQFPELLDMAQAWVNGTVVDGEALVWLPEREQPEGFAALQRRLGRKLVSKKLLAEAPVCFMAYDLLEHRGVDQRQQPQAWRRERLAHCVAEHVHDRFKLSPLVSAQSWSELARARTDARERGVEGLMLKRCSPDLPSSYGVGRSKSSGLWLKWKLDPLRADGVLIYAQAGHGRRASLYTDYTFAVWSRAPRDQEEAQAVLEAIAQRKPPEPNDLQLLAFTKAYSGLSDAEFKTVDALIRKTTLDKFGPVRAVRPGLVIELAFEGIAASPRHKSGLALRFPRMLRLRPDKPVHEANTLQDLQALIR
jgi:DNA ligase 1